MEFVLANLNTVLGEEIRRLARKEIKAHAASQKSTTRYRTEIAELKRRCAGLERRLQSLEKSGGKSASTAAPAPRATSDNAGEKRPRFSPGWVKKHRDKLGLSAADYGKLVGVSALTIYNWEKGGSSPRDKQLHAWSDVRTLGKREAARKLAEQGDAGEAE